jgi:hypothetical protein
VTPDPTPHFRNYTLLHNHVQGHILSEGMTSPAGRLLLRSHAWGGGWGTHVPLLASVVAIARRGPVLEFGCGNYSTPVLAEMCHAMGRPFYSYEEKPEWAAHFADIASIAPVSTWPAWRERDWPKDWRPSVIFVDNEPGYERVPQIEWAEQAAAEFIVVHDTLQPKVADDAHYKGMSKRLDKFKFRYDYTHMTSCTSVVSNTRAYPGAR